MNVWTASPSPSLDASSSPFHVLSTLFRRLWDAYLTHLWSYQPNSWVGRLASTFRILAVMLILPVVLLTLLDVTSYVIARTLGVVDHVKASTVDANATTHTIATERRRSVAAAAVPLASRVPLPSYDVGIDQVHDGVVGLDVGISAGMDIGAPARASEGLASEESVRTIRLGSRDEDVDADADNGDEDDDGHGCATVSETGVGTSTHPWNQGWIRVDTETWTRVREGGIDDASPRAYYFAGEEHLRLAGEGVFSPAVSMPPSPITPRMPLLAFTEGDRGLGVGQVPEGEVDGGVLRRRVQADKLGHT